MKLNELFEDAAMGATSGGDIAGARGCLFGGVAVKRQPKKIRVKKIKFYHKLKDQNT